MNQDERRRWLIEYLLNERVEHVLLPQSQEEQRLLLRALVNVREPQPATDEYHAIESEYLQHRLASLQVTDAADIPADADGLSLWQGDITTLKCDAIVNAANSGMTGCWAPNHHCIDNAIHTFAGIDLRRTCADIMENQDHLEPTGTAKITSAFNLPSRYVLHTVGPIVEGDTPTQRDRELLASCYHSCLELAAEHNLKSVAFCSISTGVFHFPIEQASNIAVTTVRDFMHNTSSSIKQVIFDVFSDHDYAIYEQLLKPADRD